jgi:hypothetical protein
MASGVLAAWGVLFSVVRGVAIESFLGICRFAFEKVCSKQHRVLASAGFVLRGLAVGKRPAVLLPSQKRRRPLARVGRFVVLRLVPGPRKAGAGNKTQGGGGLAPVGRCLVKTAACLGCGTFALFPAVLQPSGAVERGLSFRRMVLSESGLGSATLCFG